MEITCDKCGYIFEKYNNAYGTRCTKCNNLIKPQGKLSFLLESELKKNKLKEDFIEKMKEKFKENQK